jgi:hypothetical protein
MAQKKQKLLVLLLTALVWAGILCLIVLAAIPAVFRLVAQGERGWAVALLTAGLGVVAMALVAGTGLLAKRIYGKGTAAPWREEIPRQLGLALKGVGFFVVLGLALGAVSGCMALLAERAMGQGEAAKAWVDWLAALINLLALPWCVYVFPALVLGEKALLGAIKCSGQMFLKKPLPTAVYCLAIYAVGGVLRALLSRVAYNGTALYWGMGDYVGAVLLLAASMAAWIGPFAAYDKWAQRDTAPSIER